MLSRISEKIPPSAGLPVRVAALQHIFPNGVEAIRRVDLAIAAGEFVAILGPSGCGKSTLLRVIAGLERQTGGDVSVGSADDAGRSDIAFVFQDAHLLPWRTVLANAALPLELRRSSGAADLRRDRGTGIGRAGGV